MFIGVVGRVMARVSTIYIEVVFDPVAAFFEGKRSLALRLDNV